MIAKRIKLRWRLLRALCMGVILTVFIAQSIATFGNLGNWVMDYAPRSYPNPPTYLSDIAPPLEHTELALPAGVNGEALYLGYNLGFDLIEYTYGGLQDTWDIEHADIPPTVYLTRFRFGYPWRAFSFDDLSTGSSIANMKVMSYHQLMYERAGIYRGLDRPNWIPSWMPFYRIPIAPIWTGLFLNILFWSAAWYFPGVIWRTVRTHRRKRRGLCLACGYAAEDLDRCPECGSDHAAAKPDCSSG